MAPASVELRDLIRQPDLDRYYDALKRSGVSAKHLEKMTALDGLATSTGMALSVSLQKTHQNYVRQLHMLSDVCDELHEQLKGTRMPDGTLIPLSPEERSFLYRCYTEMVKEQGRGYQLMFEGTQALVRMMMMGRGDDPGNGAPQKKPGWGAGKTRK